MFGGLLMLQTNHPSSFQEVIEIVESLPVDEQEELIEIIRQRLIASKRQDLVAQVAEARQAYQRGDVRRGNASDIMRELDE
jgi:hypothetical protein